MKNFENLHTEKSVWTPPKQKKFHDLFRPIIPSLDKTGKIAQIISGLTEAITIWNITQSEMAASGKWFAILASLVACILTVAIIELGTRRMLEVITRVMVWKRFSNIWYILTFAIIVGIFGAIAVASITLSTSGINHIFTASVVATPPDTSGTSARSAATIGAIHQRFAEEKQTITDAYNSKHTSITNKYTAIVASAMEERQRYLDKFANGYSWASGTATKWSRKAKREERRMATELDTLTTGYNATILAWQKRKRTAIHDVERSTAAIVASAMASSTASSTRKMEAAVFWGGLLSWMIGVAIVVAFFCIITVEIYHRGAEMELEYQPTKPPLLSLIYHGSMDKMDAFLRKRVERWLEPSPVLSINPSKQIGFKTSVATNKNTVATSSAVVVSDPPDVSEIELLKLALRAARGTASAYKNKPPTDNNMDKLKAWNRKCDDLKKRINMIHG